MATYRREHMAELYRLAAIGRQVEAMVKQGKP